MATLVKIPGVLCPISKTSVEDETLFPLVTTTISGSIRAGSLELNTSLCRRPVRLFQRGSEFGSVTRYFHRATILPGQSWREAIPEGNHVDLARYKWMAARGDTLCGSFLNKTSTITLLCGGDSMVNVNGEGMVSAIADGTTASPLNTGTNGGGQLFTGGQYSRMRHDGAITGAAVYIVYVSDLVDLRFQVWRRALGAASPDGQYALVGESENVLLSNTLRITTVNTVVFQKPILGVRSGDYIGMSYLTNSTTNQAISKSETFTSGFFTTYTGLGRPVRRFQRMAPWENATSTATGFATAANLGIKIAARGGAPVIAVLCDSIGQGTNTVSDFQAFADNSHGASWSKDISFTKLLAQAYGVNYQNLGVGGETSTQIAARVSTQLIPSGAKIAIIMAGINDLAAEGPSGPFTSGRATYLTNMTNMVDAAIAAGMFVIVIQMAPWTGDAGPTLYGTNDQMTERDIRKGNIVTMCASRSSVLLVDPDSTIGQFRSGTSSPSNKWDIATAYRDAGTSGVHWNPTAHIAFEAYLKPLVDAKLATLNLAI